MRLAKEVARIFDLLLELTPNTYLVGGCVRDKLLGLKTKDYDFCLDKSSDEVKKYLKNYGYKVILVGEKYGTVTILGKYQVEVTTFRKELEYFNNRFPTIAATNKLEEDLSRRDFTINAICYNPATGLIDCFGGLRDLEDQIIRAIGNPTQRFNEDALRMLRAIRFAAKVNFTIEGTTFEAIRQNGHLIKNISKERIVGEMEKLFLSKNAQYGLDLLNKVGLLQLLFPDLANNDFERIKMAFSNISLKSKSRAIAFCWSQFFMSLNEQQVGLICREYKFSNDLKQTIQTCFRHIQLLNNCSNVDLKRAIGAIGKEDFPLFLKFLSSYARFTYKPSYLVTRIRKKYLEILKNNEPCKIEELAIDGNDLMELGLIGADIKKAKNFLLEAILLDYKINTKLDLIKYLRENFLPN